MLGELGDLNLGDDNNQSSQPLGFTCVGKVTSNLSIISNKFLLRCIYFHFSYMNLKTSK